jgi:2-dehydro-3-deoxyphosphogluconate aldolase/(4S)-4-hydroxy-2-oxoglutarate aldolase
MSTAVGRSRAEVLRAIEESGVVAVIRVRDPELVQGVVDALLAGGVRALEITMTVPRAIELIAQIAPKMPPEFLLGAGTVIDAQTARQVIDAGARFIVSPVYKREVIDVCREREVLSAPGCLSPTEILSPGYIKDVLAPLPQVKLMPTGGVTKENAGDWIRAGAVALGVGTSMVDSKAVSERRFNIVSENARHFINAVKQARSQKAGA